MLKPNPAPSINCCGQLLTFDIPRIMGILNLTEDSFFDGGRYVAIDQALSQTYKMLDAGADIIDVGAQSSRPGAVRIDQSKELRDITTYLERATHEFPNAIFSVDTYDSVVAKQAVLSGATIVNDVSGGSIDSNMYDVVADLKVPYILMHMRGTPRDMQNFIKYDDLIKDLAVELGSKISKLRSRNIKDIIIDPGFGFSKTIEQNHELLHRIDQLHYLGMPILCGVSRKSMIYKKLSTSPLQALEGTLAIQAILLSKGVQLLRVHDVRQAKQLVDLLF